MTHMHTGGIGCIALDSIVRTVSNIPTGAVRVVKTVSNIPNRSSQISCANASG